MNDSLIVTHTESDAEKPITITIEVQGGAITGMAASDSAGANYEVVFRLKKVPNPTEEGNGDECRCCDPGPGGALVCRDCPCV